MKLRIPTSVLFITFVGLMFFQACATTSEIDTQEKKFLVARAELNLFLEQYIRLQNDVSDQIHEEATTAFETADKILDLWESKLSPDYDFSKDYRAWLDIKTLILNVFRRIYDE